MTAEHCHWRSDTAESKLMTESIAALECPDAAGQWRLAHAQFAACVDHIAQINQASSNRLPGPGVAFTGLGGLRRVARRWWRRSDHAGLECGCCVQYPGPRIRSAVQVFIWSEGVRPTGVLHFLSVLGWPKIRTD